MPLPRGAPQSRHRAAAPASAPPRDDYLENEVDDGVGLRGALASMSWLQLPSGMRLIIAPVSLQPEGWQVCEGIDEGSGADTEMGCELLSNDEHDDKTSDPGSEDPDVALRQQQRQQQHRTYQPPDPTQVSFAPSSAQSELAT